MKGHNSVIGRFAQRVDMNSQPLPGVPLVEIAGDNRVLIENHRGVTEYANERIGVRVKYGMIFVTGKRLELSHMSRERLVICGCVDAVSIERRNG